MVELKLEAVNEAGLLPKECFLSVRIGDTQKLSRLARDRVFRFPQAGDPRRYGRIEVYQRIGACSLDVDPTNKASREVKISCGDSGFGSLGLTVGVQAEATATKQEAKEDAPSKAASKVKAAKQYLNKHGIEVQLSQAMQALLKEKPDNPAEFLASRLVPDSARFRLPPLEGAPVAPAAPLNSSPDYAPLPPGGRPPQRLEPLAPSAPDGERPKPAPHAARRYVESSPEPEPFQSYYTRNFATLPNAALDKIMASFPSANKASRQPTTTTSSPPQPSQLLPASSSPAQLLGPHVVTLDRGAVASLHAKFPANQRREPSPDSVDKKPAATCLSQSYRTKPSVGSWYCSKPVWMLRGAKAEAPTSGEQQPSANKSPTQFLGPHVVTLDRGALASLYAKFPSKQQRGSSAGAAGDKVDTVNTFQFRPSVGTWYMPRPRKIREEDEQEKAATKIQAIHRGKKARRETAETLEDKKSKEEDYTRLASVGTWLHKAPKAKVVVARLGGMCLRSAQGSGWTIESESSPQVAKDNVVVAQHGGMCLRSAQDSGWTIEPLTTA